MLSAIEVREFPERRALVAAANTKMDALGDVLAELFPKLCADAASRGVSIAGNPFTRYGASQTDGSVEIEACLPIALAEGVESSYLQACRAATVSHFGPYEGLGDAHFALGEYVRHNQFETAGLCWEEYITDPGVEPDPSKWQTLVCWPVK